MNAVPDRAHQIHAELLSAVRARRAAEHTAARLLRQVLDESLHHALGYASIYDYAEQALDLTVRQARGLMQIGGMLPSLPALDAAFSSGAISWTKARELIRVITPETEAAWVAVGVMINVFDRGQPPERGLSTASAVKLLDPGHDRDPQFLAGVPNSAVEDVLLKQREEGLHGGVVAGRADASH